MYSIAQWFSVDKTEIGTCTALPSGFQGIYCFALVDLISGQDWSWYMHSIAQWFSGYILLCSCGLDFWPGMKLVDTWQCSGVYSEESCSTNMHNFVLPNVLKATLKRN